MRVKRICERIITKLKPLIAGHELTILGWSRVRHRLEQIVPIEVCSAACASPASIP